MYPFLSYSILGIVLRFLLSSYTNSGPLGLIEGFVQILTGHYYWFLYTLMMLMVTVYLIKNFYLLVVIAIASVCLYLNTDIKNITDFTIDRYLLCFPFFVLGICLRRFYVKVIPQKAVHRLLLFMFFGLLYILFILNKEASTVIENYGVVLSGSAMVWMLSTLLSPLEVNYVKHFGKYSLQYYLNHLLIMLPIYFIAGYIFKHSIIRLFAIWILAIVCSYIMLNFQKRFKALRVLCGLNSRRPN